MSLLCSFVWVMVSVLCFSFMCGVVWSSKVFGDFRMSSGGIVIIRVSCWNMNIDINV